jgi:hypothetical protein
MTGNPAIDLQAQLNYVDQELQSNPGYGMAALKQANDPTTAAQIFGTDYERYGVAGARLSDASSVLQDAQTNSWPNGNTAALTSQSTSAGSQPAVDTSTAGDIWDGVKGAIFPGSALLGGANPLSDIAKIGEGLATAVGFAAQKQPQQTKSPTFLGSIDEILNPSVTLFNPWGIVSMAMARGGLAVFGIALLIGGLAVIVLSTSTGRAAAKDAAKMALA